MLPDGRIMIACDKSSPQDGSFCCFGDPCTDGGKCFPDQGKILSFGNQTAETTISIGESTTYGLVAPTTATFAPVVDSLSSASTVVDSASSASSQRSASQTLSSARTSVSSSSSSSVLSSRSSSLQTGSATQTSSSSSASGPGASATQSSPAQSSSPSNTPMKVGIGVGVVGGVALLSAIALIFWWRRRQTHPKSAGDRDRVEAPTSPSHPSHQNYGFPRGSFQTARDPVSWRTLRRKRFRSWMMRVRSSNFRCRSRGGRRNCQRCILLDEGGGLLPLFRVLHLSSGCMRLQFCSCNS